MKDAPDSCTTTIVPSMAMSELRQMLIDLYVTQNYADASQNEAMVVFKKLCNYIGNQSKYTPQIGRDYIDYKQKAQKLSKSCKDEISRSIYIFDCLTSNKPISARRTEDTLLEYAPSDENLLFSIPFMQLYQLLMDWQNDSNRKSPPKNTFYHLKHVIDFVGFNSNYTPELGLCFLKYIQSKDYCDSYKRACIRTIYVLDCFVENSPVQTRKGSLRISAPQIFSSISKEYTGYCQHNSKRKSTAYRKYRYAIKFLNNVESCGCYNLFELTPHIVLQACLIDPVSGCFNSYKAFLQYLADKEITMVDYSPLVPKERRSIKLPDVYSKEEILSLEATYDRETDRGKRDYAMVLLASRLKLRPSDIVTLKFEEIDFENDHIQFSQQKTDVEISLPVVPEVKEALQDYIKVRPHSDSPYVFLRTRAPYLPLSRATIYDITSNGFEEAGVNHNGRGKGPKALRSSGATHMIQGGESYKDVQDSLGQKNRNVIQHYARLDITQLRLCAIKPPSVTDGSFFAQFLKGKIILWV